MIIAKRTLNKNFIAVAFYGVTGSVYKMAYCLWKGLGLGFTLINVPFYTLPGL